MNQTMLCFICCISTYIVWKRRLSRGLTDQANDFKINSQRLHIMIGLFFPRGGAHPTPVTPLALSHQSIDLTLCVYNI